MAYRSQLVIRTADAQGVDVLERVKALADGESKTISEKAIELLALALDGASVAAPTAPEPAPERAVAPEPIVDAPPRTERTVRRDPAPVALAEEVKAKDPSIRPDEAPDEAALRCVQLFGAQGPVAAAQALTRFFAAAEPVDGANIREELQERMTKTDYDALMDELKQTEEYREYRRRVVYASW